MYQLIVAVDHMHSKGIFHRDIKPYYNFIITVRIFYCETTLSNSQILDHVEDGIQNTLIQSTLVQDGIGHQNVY